MQEVPQQNTQGGMMIQQMRTTIKLEQGHDVVLPNAYVEICGYRYTETTAQITVKGADRVNKVLTKIEDEVEDSEDGGIESVTFKYEIWATQQTKHQGLPSFGVKEAELVFKKHPELSSKFNNMSENNSEMQRMESISDDFLRKELA